jgi:cytoskeletal protein RodZ
MLILGFIALMLVICYYYQKNPVYGDKLFGETLKKRREEMGHDLRQIAETLKIKHEYLKALEDEAIKKLPAEVYVKGYIHEYAKFLNIDPEPLIKSYNEFRAALQPQKNKAPERESSQKSFRPVHILIPVFVLFCISIVILIKFSTSQKKPYATSYRDSKEITQTALHENKNVQKEQYTHLSEESEQKKNVQKATSRKILEIYATDTTWILVTTDKIESKEMLLQPGESVTLRAKDCFSLKIGDAGGISLVLNGKAISTHGEKGQVVQLELTDRNT